MQTTDRKGPGAVRRSGDVIELEDFRRRRDLAQRDSLARRPERPEEPSLYPVVLIMSKGARRQARRDRRAWALDVCASLAVVAVTLLFALRVML